MNSSTSNTSSSTKNSTDNPPSSVAPPKSTTSISTPSQTSMVSSDISSLSFPSDSEQPSYSSDSSSLSASSFLITPKKPANRCHFDKCQDKVVKIIGDCRYCSHKFCSRHRLPESHQCPNIDSCRQASFNKNAGKLLDEKCVATKV